MKINSTRRLCSAALAAAIVLAAGSTSAVVAADSKGGGALVTARNPGGRTTLSLASGIPIRTTAGVVSGPRLISFPGSATLVAVWDETSGGAVKHYFAISNDGRSFAEAQETQNLVRLRYAKFDPLAGEPAMPAELAAGPGNELFLVQFVATPLEEMRAQIKLMGGTIQRFLTDNTHVVQMKAGTRAQIAALPYVRWVGAYHPAYRLSDDARDLAMTAGPMQRVSIECMERGVAQQQAVATFITALGGIIDVVTPDQYRMEATVSPTLLRAIAARNDVNFVDPWYGPGGTDMNQLREIEGANYLQAQTGHQGQGVRGEIFDTGVVPNHQQWGGQVPLTHQATALDSHGNACYGVNFATGTGNANARGLLPMREQGIFCVYTAASSFGGSVSRLTLNTQATDPAGQFRSVFQTSSVGNARVLTYTTISAETDDYLFRVDYLSCQSQSNAGGTRDSRPEAWAKNIVSVGGIDFLETVARTDDIWHNGASVGPADDLRAKPDLGNSFINVHTTYSTSPTGYGEFNGTSSATPITAGHFGLLMQMWHEGVWTGFGGGSSVFADRPKSTTAKALMINTAYRYTPTAGNQMYRAKVGWGVPDVQRMYDIRNKTFIKNESDVILNGETLTYNVNVLPGEPEMRVTMVFSDPPGSPAAAQDRINDLTLKVTSPSSVVYWGNNGMVATAISGAGQLAGANFSTPGGSANTVDTVENVFVQNPEAGPWTIQVIASQVVQDARLETPGMDADFALVACGVQPGPPPPLVIAFPGGPPSLIAPNTPINIDFQILPGTQTVQPGSPALLYRFNGTSSFISVPASSQGGNNYRAVLPGGACGATAQFYFTATGNLGGVVTLPTNAPTGFYSSPVGTIQTTSAMNVDFSGAFPAGWSATGLWHLSSVCAPGGTPCAGSQWAYYGQDGTCNYNTTVANSGTLTAPPVAIPTVPPGGSLTLSYCYALQTENSPNYDKAQVFINGVEVDRAPDAAAWTSRSVDLAAYSGQTVTLSFGFNSVDAFSNTFRGWQIDSVRISGQTVGCPPTCYANCDGSTNTPVLNVNDFVCFQSQFAAGAPYADCDLSTVLNVNDFVCFQSAFAAGCR